jgi:hypothetical protein|tara:strand:- start:307 stop:612 length:306 start_codon:yes stop_codon:yes gene_type:complete
MEIITKPSEITQEAIDAAFVDEIKRNFKEEKHFESKRSNIARKEATQERGKTHPVLGKCVATIPSRDYFRMIKKYGQEHVHSKEFLKYYNKTFSDLSPNKV